MTDRPDAGGPIGIVGMGVVGGEVARGAVAGGSRVHLLDTRRAAAEDVAAELGESAVVETEISRLIEAVDVVVIAAESGHHVDPVRRALRARVPVISTADSVQDIRGLLGLHAEAHEARLPVLVGAGCAPGLTCVLARLLGERFDIVDEVHVAKFGTGGPACARQHHTALGQPGWDWRDGGWQERPGGSGRELVWFPEPVNGADCYRAALPDSLLLKSAFPDARRITARMAATRRDRLTAWLPMLRPPHPDGGPGAVRVELRGRRDGACAVEMIGAVADPSTGSAAVVLAALVRLREIGLGFVGVNGLGAVADPRSFLTQVTRRGVRAYEFMGSLA